MVLKKVQMLVSGIILLQLILYSLQVMDMDIEQVVLLKHFSHCVGLQFLGLVFSENLLGTEVLMVLSFTADLLPVGS